MDEWKEGIWLGVSAIVTAMLITFAVILGNVSQSVTRLQQKDINAVASMEEYRKWAKYDNTVMNQADVISCINENKSGIPAVLVSKDICSDNNTNPFVLDSNTKSFSDPNFFNAECSNNVVSIDNISTFNDDFITKHTWNNSTLNPSYLDTGNIRSYYMWDGSNPRYEQPNNKAVPNQNDYDLDNLYKYIPPEATYRANLVKDAGGAVAYIWFRRVPLWARADRSLLDQDSVRNCILENRGSLSLAAVTTGIVPDEPNAAYTIYDVQGSANYYWYNGIPSSYYSTDTLAALIPDGKYREYIIRETNGAVMYIWYRRIN